MKHEFKCQQIKLKADVLFLVWIGIHKPGTSNVIFVKITSTV